MESSSPHCSKHPRILHESVETRTDRAIWLGTWGTFLWAHQECCSGLKHRLQFFALVPWRAFILGKDNHSSLWLNLQAFQVWTRAWEWGISMGLPSPNWLDVPWCCVLKSEHLCPQPGAQHRVCVKRLRSYVNAFLGESVSFQLGTSTATIFGFWLEIFFVYYLGAFLFSLYWSCFFFFF